MPRVARNNTVSNEITTNNNYLENGVSISPVIPTVGEKVKIKYDGLLSKCGATHVYAHVGYGSNWDNVYDYQMTKTGTGFEVSIPVSKPGTLNVCFKDCANNWDNNSGKNYSFNVAR
ncbi:MAG TPA: carbohydrate-binding protein [Clostridiaceae bacterium]|nr:carbohydrate-binding protein [Clostridiaceae bacterium]